MLNIIRSPGLRPKYKPEKVCETWTVIDSLSGDQLVFDAERGDDEEVITRSPRVFGPTTFGRCQCFVDGTEEERALLRKQLACERQHGCLLGVALQTGIRMPLIKVFN